MNDTVNSIPLWNLSAVWMISMFRKHISFTPAKIQNCRRHGTQSKTSVDVLSHTANQLIGWQVYIVPISGSEAPFQLTSGKQGATHSLVFNTKGTKVAWLALDEDGYESDRYISLDNISMTTDSI